MLGGLAIILSMGHCQIASPGQAGSPLSRRSTVLSGVFPLLCSQSSVSFEPLRVCTSFILTRPAGSSGSLTQAERKAELLRH